MSNCLIGGLGVHSSEGEGGMTLVGKRERMTCIMHDRGTDVLSSQRHTSRNIVSESMAGDEEAASSLTF